VRWSASALKAHCAAPNVLKKLRPPSPSSQLAIDKGVTFHAAVECWVKSGQPPHADDLEIQGWLDLLASQWVPPQSTLVEIAWGLSPQGEHVHVAEPKPHVYEAINGAELLTAGRADALWLEFGVLRVVDWKAGRWPVAPARENLQALAGSLALAARFGVDVYQPGIYYAQDGAWDWGDAVMRGSETAAQAFEAVKAAALLDDQPHPGNHCGSCWERKACAPGAAYLAAT
jgi:hypothetical protein